MCRFPSVACCWQIVCLLSFGFPLEHVVTGKFVVGHCCVIISAKAAALGFPTHALALSEVQAAAGSASQRDSC